MNIPLIRNTMRTSHAGLIFASLLLLMFPRAGVADSGTNCPFGGPTPSWAIVKLDLSQSGSSFLTLDLGGVRSQRAVNSDQNWHMAEGVFVVDASTLKLMAYRLDSQGMAPRHAVVTNSGTPAADQPVSAPEVPFEHVAASLRSELPAGVYYVIAFGSDGGAAPPNEQWSAAVTISGTHACTPVGEADVLDINQSNFTGGTQVYAPGAGYANGISSSFQTQRQLVVGMIDAESQIRAASTVSVDYRMPTVRGTVSQELIPFVSTAGRYDFTASYQGVYPLINIAGIAATL